MPSILGRPYVGLHKVLAGTMVAVRTNRKNDRSWKIGVIQHNVRQYYIIGVLFNITYLPIGLLINLNLDGYK